jgi:hypothetical protein
MIETWTSGDQISVVTDSGATLSSFRDYKNNVLDANDETKDHDNAQFLSYVILSCDVDIFICVCCYTHAKILHLVTSLSTSHQHVVFALLVTSCQQVWNKLLTICNNLVDIIRLVTRLFQQVRYSHNIAILLQSCVVNLVTFLFIMT